MTTARSEPRRPGIRALLAGRLSRRIFVLFLASAIVPLTIVALLTHFRAREALLEQAQQHLASEARRYGMAIFERLQMARQVAASEPNGSGLRDDSRARQIFTSLGVVEADGNLTAVFGQPRLAPIEPGMVRSRPDGEASMLVRPDGSRSIGVVFREGKRTVAGELIPAYLWGSAETLARTMDFCVLEKNSRRVLHCTAPDGPMAASVLGPAPGEAGLRKTSWIRDGERVRAVGWSPPGLEKSGMPDWVVVAAQSEAIQLAALREIWPLYLALAAITLLYVTWLSMRHARSILEPVGRLVTSARAIGKRDFSTPVSLHRDDEIGELGSAFDHMSLRLGRQFSSLSALSEIDRMILADADMDPVIRKVLGHLRKTVPGFAHAVVLFDRENHERARTHLCSADSDEISIMKTQAGSNDSEVLRAASKDGTWLDTGTIWPASLAPLRVAGANHALLLPIAWRDSVCGVVAIGFETQAAFGESERTQTREFADRVAIVVSSAWRDEQLFVQAHFDPLTGLPNRLLFQDRIALEIVRCQRNRERFALLFIDLDNFKTVNDAYGHSVGDLILHEASRRIVGSVRKSDTVSRIGGDEFTVILTELSHGPHAGRVGQEIINRLSAEFAVAGMSSFLSASIGIACYPDDGSTAEDLLKNADTAMYRAKAAGRSRVAFFEKLMNTDSRALLALERDLRLAILHGELELHYQPQLDIRTGAIRAAEALVRWNHPKQGMIAPGRFIPLAESTGLIVPLGEWVLREGCRQMKSWRDAGVPLEQIAINASPRQFRSRDYLDFVRNCVRDAGLPPGFLEIEITEGMLLDNNTAVHDMLAELSAQGIGIALDDFGTGYSSMAYLTRFPVDAIKIDRAFVDGLGRRADAEAIVAAILVLSRALGKRVVAEGVETEDQLARLRALRCDRIQGFLVSPALPAAQFEAFVAASQPALRAPASARA